MEGRTRAGGDDVTPSDTATHRLSPDARARDTPLSATAALGVRPANPDDASAIRDLVRAAYAKYVVRIGREPAPMTADYAALIVAGEVWVGVIDTVVVGVVVLQPHTDALQLDNIAVAPSQQGQGIGRVLLAFVEERALALGTPAVTLYTNERMSEDIEFYTRLGYVETTRREVDGFRRVFFRKNVHDSAVGRERAH